MIITSIFLIIVGTPGPYLHLKKSYFHFIYITKSQQKLFQATFLIEHIWNVFFFE